MSLATLGWAVVHSLWQGAVLAGLTAMILAVLTDRRPRPRYVVGCVSLTIMAIAPFMTALAEIDLIGRAARFQVVRAVDGAIGLPTVVVWRSIVVQSAAVLWIAGVGICLARVGMEWRRARALRRLDIADAGKD